MNRKPARQHTRREEQIMEIIFRLGKASVADIMAHLPNSPTAGAVRRMLNLLYAKGAVTYKYDGAKKVYRSTIERDLAGERALRHLMDTFFAGSAARTMASLFNSSSLRLPKGEKEQLRDLIEKAKKKGR